mgnify:CR=1 FL=1
MRVLTRRTAGAAGPHSYILVTESVYGKRDGLGLEISFTEVRWLLSVVNAHVWIGAFGPVCEPSVAQQELSIVYKFCIM